MAKQVQVMPPAVLPPLEPGDERLTPEELGAVSVFAAMKRSPNFEKYPGTYALRRCPQGRVICRQGDEGGTAFLILTTEDMLRVREMQLASLDATLQIRATNENGGAPHKHFSLLSEADLCQRRQEICREIQTLRTRAEQLAGKDDRDDLCRVASANLLTSLNEANPRRGLLNLAARLFRSSRTTGAAGRSALIPIDGPTDIEADTLSAPLFEGELFGEMSCINRAARSATVIADRDCYLLEMLRNVLDMLHSDPDYKARMDETYRRRVLESQVRRLSIFQNLSNSAFAQLQESIELVDFAAGSIIFEEHETSDSFFVVRSGLVKVVKYGWSLLRAEEFCGDEQWNNLARDVWQLAGDELGQSVWKALPVDVQDAIGNAADGNAGFGDEQQSPLCDALNKYIGQADVPKEFGKWTDEVVRTVGSPQLQVAVSNFPLIVGKWSEIERRTFFRSFLEHLYPSLPRRAASAGPRRTLAYLGRGEFFGEMGVMAGLPRNATVYAYDHPDGSPQQRIPDARTGAVPSRVELVRIGKQAFEDLLAAQPELKRAVQQEVSRREAELKSLAESRSGAEPSVLGSQEFEELGLIQGQQLMLIDLDRCTRCNACVDACVTTHDDGHTRLYLDGPRYGNYLVPLTCRKCLDPVCMIGCPVGAINRGGNGEIRIENWCIGCRMCAEQCPYGSIQMTELSGVSLNAAQQQILAMNEEIRAVDERAVVCDLCSSLRSQDPSCVYACPHDAAIRVNAREFFFESAP